MSWDIDSLLGVHAPALALRARRNEMLAANIANADTPGFQARDIDFASALRQSSGVEAPAVRMASTSAAHLDPAAGDPFANVPVLYRVPAQPSLDGNTVDVDVEKAAFGRNAVEYQASLMFLNNRTQSILRALKGE